MGNLEKRIGELEVRLDQAGGVQAGPREKGLARDRALHERVRECAQEDPELYVRYENALDAHLEAIEVVHVRSRVRTETTETAGETEVLETMEAVRTYEQLARIERLLLGEDEDG